MIECITADELPVRHGFFTRRGGVSRGIFAGLNCGPGSSDRATDVAANRALVAGAMGVAPDALLSLHQVHSADVVTVTGPLARRPRADGLVTRMPGLALAITTADCQPVLFADAEAGVIGAVHAGWRGAFGGVIEAALTAMEHLGARREAITAVIGPCIGPRSYEVGAEFRAEFIAAAPENARFFTPGHAASKHLFDLPGYSLARLHRAGVGRSRWTGEDTFTDAARFFSYRRATHAREPDYGRQLAVIRL